MNFRRSLRNRTLYGCAALGLLASTSAAQTPADPSQSRIDELERQVKMLSESLQKRDATPPSPPIVTIDPNAINAIVDQRLQQVQAATNGNGRFRPPASMTPGTASTAPASASAGDPGHSVRRTVRSTHRSASALHALIRR